MCIFGNGGQGIGCYTMSQQSTAFEAMQRQNASMYRHDMNGQNGIYYTGNSFHPSDKYKMFAAIGACKETAYGSNIALNRKLDKAKEWMKSRNNQ